MRLFILHPTLPAYRKDFFEALDKRLISKNIELTVIHGTSFFNKTIHSDSNPQYSAIPLLTKESKFLGFRIVRWKGIFTIIRRIKPDMILILFNPGNLTFWLVQLYCYLFKIKIGLWSNGSVRLEITGIKKKIRGFFLNFFLYHAKFHICYGTRYRKELLALGIDESKIFVAQNTVNIEKILSLTTEKHESSEDQYNFLYVGALIDGKNLEIAIKALSNLIREGYKIQFNIIGQGAIIEELRSLVNKERMGEHIFVLGYKSEKTIHKYFFDADIFLLPGTGGLAINEAMAYGLPVISTIADGTIIDLLFEGQNGYFLEKVPSEDNIYAVCKKAILNEKVHLNEMGNLSKKIVSEKATLKNMVDSFEKAILYEMK